jgi:hypothetical protein
VKPLFCAKNGVKYFSLMSIMLALLLLAACSTGQSKTTVPVQSANTPLKSSNSVSETSPPFSSAAPSVAVTGKVMPSLTHTSGLPADGKASPVSVSSSGVKISLIKNSQPSHKGDAFKVNIELSTDVALRGIQWKLSFDARTMQLLNINEGNIFKNWARANNGSTIVFPKPAIDNTAGIVSDMGIAVMTKTPGGATGNGTLCDYDFVALVDQVGIPTISDVVLCDVNGKTFPYTDIAK